MKKFKTFVAEFKVYEPKSVDTLGFTRDKMPQVRSQDYDGLIKHLKKNNVGIKKIKVPAKSLKPIQKEFNKDKVVGAIAKIKTLGQAKPLIVSKDNYIIDGHHRWLAAKNVGLDIDIMKADVKVRELLKHVYTYPKTFTKKIHEGNENVWEIKKMKSFKQLTEAVTGQIYDTKPQSSDDATNPEVLLRGYGRLRHDQVKEKVVEYLEKMVKQAKRENWGSIEYEMKMLHLFMDAVQDVEKEMDKPAWKKKVTMLKRQGK